MPSKYQNLNPLQWTSRCCHFPDNLGPWVQLTTFCNWNKQVYFTTPRVRVFSQQPWSLPCGLSWDGKKNVNLCLMLANSIKVPAGCLSTCSDTSAWGSSLEVPGQGSLHQGQPHQGLGQRPVRAEVPDFCLHPACEQLNMQFGELWTGLGCHQRAALPGSRQLGTNLSPERWQMHPVCDTGASPLVCLPLMQWAQLGAFHSGDICRISLTCWTTYLCEPDVSSLLNFLESGPISRNSGRAHKQYSATSLGNKTRNSF